ncbi:uroporphyrinogen decarboxylase, partial [Bacteroidota bacterium]
MTEEQWNLLLDTIDGKLSKPIPSGFLIDSPWLPGWYGISTLDYYTNNKYWLEANFKAINTFPELMFLPGFWSEYG